MSNPKYVQNYLRKYSSFLGNWTNEQKEKYTQDAKFTLIDKARMFDAEHPIISSTIIAAVTAVIATVILSRAL